MPIGALEVFNWHVICDFGLLLVVIVKQISISTVELAVRCHFLVLVELC